MLTAWLSGWSAEIVIQMVSVQNLLTPFYCVLGKDTLQHFLLLGGLGDTLQHFLLLGGLGKQF